MLADNNTPFAAIGFEHNHRDGMSMAVVAARGTFELMAGGRLQLAARQALVLTDVYEGQPLTTPLIRAGDLIPFKPFADITILADAHAPGGKPARTWDIGLRVDEANHGLRVHAARVWRWEKSPHDLGAWYLRYTENGATQIPLDYRLAVGGKLHGDPHAEPDPRNPLGRAGMAQSDAVKRDATYPAAQIESTLAPVTNPFHLPEPEGLGPVAPWWQWRLRHAGTYDDDWHKMRAPRPPHDFQYRFHQVAHPELILPSHFRGGEVIQLAGMVPGGGAVGFRLPDIAPWAVFDFIDGRQVQARLNCDGVHIDLRQGPPWRLDLTWRAWMASCPQFWKVDLNQCKYAEAAHLPFSNETGLVEARG